MRAETVSSFTAHKAWCRVGTQKTLFYLGEQAMKKNPLFSKKLY